MSFTLSKLLLQWCFLSSIMSHCCMWIIGNGSNHYLLVRISRPRAIQTPLLCLSHFQDCPLSHTPSHPSHLTTACVLLGMALIAMYYLQEAITKASIPFPFSPASLSHSMSEGFWVQEGVVGYPGGVSI